MIETIDELHPSDLTEPLDRALELAREKVMRIAKSSSLDGKTPVFTVDGQYVAQGWTEWTQGFQFGAALLCFDATDDHELLRMGRDNTIEKMATHVTSIGVHDHGFNNVSTYGALRRLMLEQRIPHDQRELDLYELALKASGAVQAARWSETDQEEGYIYSFNGPHSLFCDTMRSLRSLALAHQLGHVLMDENDEPVSLLQRLVEHASTTARFNVYYGEDRDVYDVRGRVAHESIFNPNDGCYRCPNTQQGYSPFSTWTRGLSWVMLGFPEQLEFLSTRTDDELDDLGGREALESMMLAAARAACDFYIENTPTDGVPYWDTGAPGLSFLGDYLQRPADPFNDHEPVDSSAAAVACQGLLRLAHYLRERDPTAAKGYEQAGLTVLKSLVSAPYLSTSPDHEGLLLHGIYHRPRGWDHIPSGAKSPRGEACMWGDYHLLEAALYVKRLESDRYYTFWGSSV
jgi:hypothetical protein